MKVKDLYLGEVEGAEEFKTKEAIEQLYFLNTDEDAIEYLLSGKRRYIHGYKGTGKTSLIKVLENRAQEKNIDYISISYRTLREDAEFVYEFRQKFESFKKELDAEKDKDTIALTFWKWYLLSLISKQYIKPNTFDLIYETGNGIFRTISNLIDMIVVTFAPSGEISIGTNTSYDNNDDTHHESIVKAAQKIRILTNDLKSKLNKKVIIFIDELELSKARSTYDIDRILIKNLILATKSINQINDNLHVVLAVRDEVLYNLRGDEINKLRDDFGISLNWWYNSYISLEHNLWKLVFKKIRYSMKQHNENYKINNQELWSRWFPFKIDEKESWKFLFNLTWARPRDFVRLLSLMQEHSKEMTNFTRLSYDMALKAYSERALSEISEELTTLFNDDEMDKIIKVIQKLGINFTEEAFIKISEKYNIHNPNKVLDEMYRVSFIGNHYKLNNRSIWRFYFRGDQLPEYSQAFEVHPALHSALGIKGRFSYKIFAGIKDNNNNDNDDDELRTWSL